MKNIKAIITDLDRTLLRTDKSLSEYTVDVLKRCKERGIKVIICAAGMAAHLAGVIASFTVLPVIGIPMVSEPFSGMDALLAMVQMPPGIPVSTVTAGPAGAKNAALSAVAILALNDPALKGKLKDFRAEQTRKVQEADSQLQQELGLV